MSERMTENDVAEAELQVRTSTGAYWIKRLAAEVRASWAEIAELRKRDPERKCERGFPESAHYRRATSDHVCGVFKEDTEPEVGR